jgi:two-component system response regulator PilR (NtrC family)
MAANHILVVDDDLSMRQFMQILLERSGYEVVTAASAEEALERFDEKIPDLVLTDLNMPGMNGLELLIEVKARAARAETDVEVIVVTAYGSTRTAVDAMVNGAANYVLKPFNNTELRHVLRAALQRRALQQENTRLRAELQDRYHFENLIGSSPAMQRIYELIRRVKDTRINCLIVGESGTGKEVVARAIHFSGNRSASPFVPINCGAIPESLLESELFGHKKGSFTGAVRDKKGLMESAGSGTLFLDEINSLPQAAQVKLLRAIQERKVTPVGALREVEVNARIIAASNADLEAAVKDGRFRDDLYYRLNVVQIGLPALRERSTDIPELVRHFVRRFAKEYDRPDIRLSPDALRTLQAWHFPGNVRELGNIIERAVALCDGSVVDSKDLPDRLAEGGVAPLSLSTVEIPGDGVNLDSMLSQTERQWLLAALERAGGNKTQAAELLKMSFRSFRYRLAKLGLDHLE